MRRAALLLSMGALFAFGCSQAPMDMMPKKPPVPEEMVKLTPWVGSWMGTAEMVSPSAEEMKKAMGPNAADMPTSFKGEEKIETALGGLFLRHEGWHEMGKDQRASYQAYTMWDPKAKKYRMWQFSDYGEVGTGWMTPTKDGRGWQFEYTGTDASGRRTTGTGMITMPDPDTMTWTWTEQGPMGKMELKGTSKRQ